MIFWTRMHDTPLGDIILVEEDGKLKEISISKQNESDRGIQDRLEALDPDVYQQDSPFLNRVESELREYFTGERETFDIPVTFAGTEFQEKVWEVIASIPFGETLSYGEIADKIEIPNAARAIGNACGNNPIPIIVPCHRVLASNGKLGGYSSGLDNKRTLLSLENIGWK